MAKELQHYAFNSKMNPNTIEKIDRYYKFTFDEFGSLQIPKVEFIILLKIQDFYSELPFILRS